MHYRAYPSLASPIILNYPITPLAPKKETASPNSSINSSTSNNDKCSPGKFPNGDSSASYSRRIAHTPKGYSQQLISEAIANSRKPGTPLPRTSNQNTQLVQDRVNQFETAISRARESKGKSQSVGGTISSRQTVSEISEEAESYKCSKDKAPHLHLRKFLI